jgi:hypothetical protein
MMHGQQNIEFRLLMHCLFNDTPSTFIIIIIIIIIIFIIIIDENMVRPHKSLKNSFHELCFSFIHITQRFSLI